LLGNIGCRDLVAIRKPTSRGACHADMSFNTAVHTAVTGRKRSLAADESERRVAARHARTGEKACPRCSGSGRVTAGIGCA
jgi:hypothetical protein